MVDLEHSGKHLDLSILITLPEIRNTDLICTVEYLSPIKYNVSGTCYTGPIVSDDLALITCSNNKSQVKADSLSKCFQQDNILLCPENILSLAKDTDWVAWFTMEPYQQGILSPTTPTDQRLFWYQPLTASWWTVLPRYGNHRHYLEHQNTWNPKDRLIIPPLKPRTNYINCIPLILSRWHSPIIGAITIVLRITITIIIIPIILSIVIIYYEQIQTWTRPSSCWGPCQVPMFLHGHHATWPHQSPPVLSQALTRGLPCAMIWANFNMPFLPGNIVPHLYPIGLPCRLVMASRSICLSKHPHRSQTSHLPRPFLRHQPLHDHAARSIGTESEYSFRPRSVIPVLRFSRAAPNKSVKGYFWKLLGKYI